MADENLNEEVEQEVLNDPADIFDVEVETPVEPTPETGEPEAEQQEEPQGSPFRQSLAAQGWDVDRFEDDAALADAVTNHMGQLQQYAQYGQQVAPHYSEFQEYLNSKKPAPEPQDDWSPEKHFSSQWQRPEYQDKWDHYIQSGEVFRDPDTGMFKGEAPHTAEAAQGLNEYHGWQKKSLSSYLENPYQKNWEAIQEPLERKVRDILQREMDGVQQQQRILDYQNRNAELLFQYTGEGENKRMVVDPTTGQGVYSPLGNRIMQHATSLRQGGMQGTDAILEYATNMALGEIAMQQYSQPAKTDQTPKQKSGEKMESFIDKAMKKAAHNPGRSGATPEGDDLPGRFENFEHLSELFTQAQAKAGL